jgi:ATP-dependent exoDNAse (exonuclease V) alpha subunit
VAPGIYLANFLRSAPTGRAAKRMTEATGLEAKTIHWLLEVDLKGGSFKPDDNNLLDCDLLVVDEASMVDVMLMQSLMKAMLNRAALLIVGDIDQLPSVGPGRPSAGPHHLIRCGAAGAVRADSSGASHTRSRTARRERHATETPGQPRQRAGGYAAAYRAIGSARPNRT